MPAHGDWILLRSPFTVRRGGAPRPPEADTSTYPCRVNGDLNTDDWHEWVIFNTIDDGSQ